MRPVEHDPTRLAPADFNQHQRQAVQTYGVSQSAVDYILSQRYGGEYFAGQPVGPEGYGMISSSHQPSAISRQPRPVAGHFPSALELRYRGL